jgi:hypothetical protein
MSDLVTRTARRKELVSLSISLWRTRKLNRKETIELNARMSTNAGSVIVRVCSNPKLAAIETEAAAIYQAHKSMTFPTVQDGLRMIPVDRTWKYKDMIADHRATWDELVNDFVAEYPTMRADAPNVLNGLYDERAWPSAGGIRDKFALRSQLLECNPDASGWREWLEESNRAASIELRTEIEKALVRMRDRCGSGGKLYDTVFSSLRELLAGVPDLDIPDDSELGKLIAQAAPLADHDAELVRDNDALRTGIASSAGSILDVFGTGALAETVF